MSIFASQTQATVPIPFDRPNTVTIRRLTGREVEAAQEAHRSSIATASARSWAATFRRMLEHGASDPDVLKVVADPLTGYDRYSLVRSGLVAWSYPLPVKPADGALTGAVDDLDDEAVDFIAREALRLTKPGLFHATEEDAEKERKNGIGSSTVT